MAIKTCTCEHKDQDEMYGKGQRVHNLGTKTNVWRCTVCLKEKSIKGQ